MVCPDSECSWFEIAGRAEERGLGPRVGEGGGDAVFVVV